MRLAHGHCGTRPSKVVYRFLNARVSANLHLFHDRDVCSLFGRMSRGGRCDSRAVHLSSADGVAESGFEVLCTDCGRGRHILVQVAMNLLGLNLHRKRGCDALARTGVCSRSGP